MALITNNISGSSSDGSKIGITGSVIISNSPDAQFPRLGSDAVFFVSGSESAKAVLGGAAKISGSLTTDGNVTLGNSSDDVITITGVSTFQMPASFNSGLSGSLTKLTDGTSYLIAGSNVTITTGSTGAVTIASTGGGSTVGGAENNIIYRDSSNIVTGSYGLRYDGVSIKVNGNLESVYSNGDEGGEIFLNKSVTNTSLNTGVTIDVNQNRLRFFENGGTNRGYYLDISDGGTGASTNLVGGGGGGGAPTGAQYVTLATNASLTDERVLTAGTGITLTDGGAGSTITAAINNSVVATVSGTTFTGVTRHNAGLSGSLTKLTDGSSYLIAGSNITITTSSAGAVTIDASPSTSPGGLNTQVQFNDSSTFGGDSGLTYNKTTKVLNATNVSGGALTGSNVSTGQVIVAGTSGVLSGNNNLFWNNANARLGIGYAFPSSPLYVSGSPDATSTPAAEIMGAWIRLGDFTANSTFNNGVGIKFHDQGLAHYSIGQLSGNFIISNTNDNGAVLFSAGRTDGITMNASGLVGVGSSPSGARLYVSGSSSGTSLLVRHGVNTTGNIFDVQTQDGTSGLIVSSSGLVGIGVAPTSRALHVSPAFRLGGATDYYELIAAGGGIVRWALGGSITTVEMNNPLTFPPSMKLGFQSALGSASDSAFSRAAAGIINVSGSAPGALFRFNASSTPLAAGDLSMNTTTGRPGAFIGGSARSLAHTDEIPSTFFSSTTAGSIFTSGSAAFVGSENVDSPADKGTDVFFYVSGSATTNNTSTSKSLFGGDVRVSGTLVVGTGSITITSNDIQLGSTGHIQFGSSASRIALVGSNLTLFDSSSPNGKTLDSLVASSGSYTTSFTNASLTSGILTITHNLNSQYVVAAVYDNSNKQIVPDEVTATSANVTTIDLTSFGSITGTWSIIVIRSGGTAASASSSATSGLVLVESKVLTGSVQTLTFSNLNGNADKVYKLFVKKPNQTNTTSGTPVLRPNGATTGLGSQTLYAVSDSASANKTSHSYWYAGSGATVAQGSANHAMEITIFAETGATRWMHAKMSIFHANAYYYLWDMVGWWTDTTTNLTSLELYGDVLGLYPSGTMANLYKVV